MYDPSTILTWLSEKVEGMRLSRMKTLAIIACAAMRMNGTGVLALGRAMDSPAKANTVSERVLSLARIGNYFLQTAQAAIPYAIVALLELPT